jgi:DNA-binding response OmpR family regulator
MPNKTYTILIVEDEWINANFIKQILESLKQKVVAVASSAKEAMECLEENDVDFIFMDINIDGAEDGITLAHKINQTKKIPIIFMTAFGDSSTIEEASQTNIYGFIIKPFMERDVEAVFNVAIQRVLRENKFTQAKLTLRTSTVTLGTGYTFELPSSVLRHNHRTIALSKNESKLLHLLCSNHGQILPMAIIRHIVWEDKDVSESNIRETILRVRKKITPLNLENLTGVGYILHKEL